MTLYEYHENNSGGYTIMQDVHYDALEQAGWKVERETTPYATHIESVTIEAPDLDTAIGNWEGVTGMDFHNAPYCECCGYRHEMSESWYD